MTDARIGYGAKYEIWDAANSVYFQIGEVINFTPPEATTDRVDATHMLSPGRRREYISGLIDSGEGSLEINWVPGNPTDVFCRALLTSGATVNHRITFNNGQRVVFEASITGFTKATPIDDRMTATITVSASGDETWEAETAPVNIILPAISGLAEEGEVLTALEGIWDGAASFTYQWKRDGSDISGAVGKTYTLVSADATNPISVAVTATNSAGSTSATSGETADVTAA